MSGVEVGGRGEADGLGVKGNWCRWGMGGKKYEKYSMLYVNLENYHSFHINCGLSSKLKFIKFGKVFC